MGKAIKELTGLAFARHSVRIAWIVSIIFLVVGYSTPPLGDMPDWVLPSIGWTFAFAALLTMIGALEQGLNAQFKHGDTEINITSDDD